jgi:excisionase family DNA binding protein
VTDEWAARLRALADRAGDLDAPELAGEIEALRARLWAAAITPPTDAISAAAAPDPSRLLTDGEVAQVLGVGRSTVEALRRRGSLPGVAVGDKYVRTRRRDLDAFVAGLPIATRSQKYAADDPFAGPRAPNAPSGAAPPAPPRRPETARARRDVRHG